MLERRLDRSVLVGMFLLVVVSSTPAQQIRRVSVDASGAQGDGLSGGNFFDLSPNGRWVAFTSDATNLVAADQNGWTDIFVRDLQTGAVSRVSVDSAGNESNGPSIGPTISADGNRVAFFSFASNLVPGDTNGKADVFLHDRSSGTTTRVSVSTGGVEGNRDSFWPRIAESSTEVAFYSQSSNLAPGDTNGVFDIFVHDTATGVTERIVSDAGVQPNDRSISPAISPDGRWVAFDTLATNYVAGQSQSGILLHDRVTQMNELVNLDLTGQPVTAQGPVDLTADARFVTFTSDAGFLPGDQNGAGDLFVRDRLLATTERLSVGSGNVESIGNIAIEQMPRMLSEDGRYAVFVSHANNLVPDDNNDGSTTTDVFLRDREIDATVRVGIGWTSRQLLAGASRGVISGDGSRVVFWSPSSAAVPQDTNGTHDVFLYDPLRIALNGTPSAGQPISFTVSNGPGEAGHAALVLLSCTGSVGLLTPGGNAIPLTPDPCTTLSVSLGLSGILDGTGATTTPSILLPAQTPIGLRFYAAAITFNSGIGKIQSLSPPAAFTTQ